MNPSGPASRALRHGRRLGVLAHPAVLETLERLVRLAAHKALSEHRVMRERRVDFTQVGQVLPGLGAVGVAERGLEGLLGCVHLPLRELPLYCHGNSSRVCGCNHK